MKDGAPGLIALLTQLYKSLNRSSSEELLGMRLKEFVVLGYLREHRGITQQELGEAMLLDPNTVVLLLNALEGRGFAIRRRDREDRRRHVVELTADGEAALTRAEKARETIEEEVFGELDAEERRTLRRLMLRALERTARIR